MAMQYREIAPRPELRDHVRCFWLLAGPASERVERVVPDGCCEIVLNRADPFRGLEENRIQPDVMVVGQIRRFIRIVPTGVVDLLGIRFHPGGMWPFLGASMDGLADERIDARAVCPRLRAALEDAAHRDLARVERLLLERLRPGNGLAAAAVRAIERSGGRASIGDVAAHVGVNGRRLERLFRREIGVPPKLLARIVRFQRAITTAERAPQGGWAGVALDCGYYDQAHLVNEFRHFAGVSPARYFATEHPMADFFAGVGFFQSGDAAER